MKILDADTTIEINEGGVVINAPKIKLYSPESTEVIIPLSYLETLIRENERLKVNSEKKQVTNTVVNVDSVNANEIVKAVIKKLEKRSFDI